MSPITRLVPGKSALFICDIQDRFRPVIHAFPSLVNTATKMVTAAGLLDIPVVVTEQNPKVLGATVPIGLDLLPAKLQADYSPLAKTKFSMVLPPVIESLNKWETESVILVGIESHICILQTTLDLLQLGLGVFVLADGVSSANKQEIPIALDRLRACGAQVTTSESVLFELMVDSSHASFRSVSSLVKQTKSGTAEALAALVGPADESR